MTDKERRDKRFRKLCKWMSEAREIAEILREECAQIEREEPEEQKDMFPGLAFGLMFLGVAVGEMKLSDGGLQ